MNNNKTNENEINVVVKKRRGRPRKYNKIQMIKNVKIEKDLILFIPYVFKMTNKEDDFDKQIKNLIFKETKTDKELVNSINEVDELKEMLKNQIILNNKYREKIKNIKIYNENIKSNCINCPFKVNEDKTIIIPEYTALSCFHDSCKIKGKPIFLPEKEENGCFYIIGWFCSVNCAIAYNFNMKDDRVSYRLSLLNRLYKISRDVKPAPSNKLLKKFGGLLTIEEYRDLFYDKFNNYSLVVSPIKCLNFYIEKI